MNPSGLRILYIITAIAVLGLACSIPFYFESPSMFYKTGFDRFLLRTGKILGIIAATLIFFQIVLISRFKHLEKVFKIKTLFQSHRTNGLILLGAAVLHPVFILGADDFVLFPFEAKYWPEIVGIALIVLLFLFVVISYWQKQFGLNIKIWRLLHKTFAPVIFILLFIHIFNVSRTFESGLPFYILVFIFSAGLGLIVRKYYQ